MSKWDDLWIQKPFSIIDQPRHQMVWLAEIRAEGDEMQDKNRELNAYLSVEQVLAKRWEKYIELMGDDLYTELEPEEYVAMLDKAEERLGFIQKILSESQLYGEHGTLIRLKEIFEDD